MDIKFDASILPYHRELPITDAYFLGYYKGSMYEVLNHEMRHKKFADLKRQHQVYAYYLDNLIRRQERSREPMFLYRGLNNQELQSLYFDRPTALLSKMFKEMVGECIVFPSFLSTSYNPNIACDFATSDNVNSDINDDNDAPIILKFKIPPNFPLLAVDEAINQLNKFSRQQQIEESEYEILLPYNMVFRVVSVKKAKCSFQKREKGKDVLLITLDATCPQIKPATLSLTKKDARYLSLMTQQ